MSAKEEGFIVLKSFALVLIPMILIVILLYSLLTGIVNDYLLIGILLLILLVVDLALFLGVAYFWLAPNNIFFTFVEEGTAVVVLTNQAYKKTLISFEGHHLENEFLVEDKESDDGNHSVVKKGLIQKILGLMFIGKGLHYLGIWPFDRVYYYDFIWTSIDSEGKPRPHEKRTISYIFLKKDVYWSRLSNIEDKEGLPLTIDVVLTMSVVSPFVALMRTDRWLDSVINFIRAEIRSEIAKYKYEELINRNSALNGKKTDPHRSCDDGIGKGLGDEIYGRLNSYPDCPVADINYEVIPDEDSDLRYIEEKFGVRIWKIGIADVNPEGNLREATLKAYMAEKEANAQRIAAEMNAHVVRITADAEADAIKKIGEANAEQQAETTFGSVRRAFLKGLGISEEEAKNISNEDLMSLKEIWADDWREAEEMVKLKIKVDHKAYIHIEGSNKGESVSPLAEAMVLSEYFRREDGKRSQEIKEVQKEVVVKKRKPVKKTKDENEEVELTEEAKEILEREGIYPEDAIERS